jgi:hypothetical protein
MTSHVAPRITILSEKSKQNAEEFAVCGHSGTDPLTERSCAFTACRQHVQAAAFFGLPPHRALAGFVIA